MVRVAWLTPITKASTTIITMVPTVTAPKASLPSRLPTHRPLISWMDTCSKLLMTIGSENAPSCLGMDPSVKFFIAIPTHHIPPQDLFDNRCAQNRSEATPFGNDQLKGYPFRLRLTISLAELI